MLKIKKISDEDSGHEKESHGQLSPWLQQVLNQIQKKPTAVEAAKQRQQNAESVVSQVNNIIHNRPRYATVEDAVQDMRERTGLHQHLEALASKKKTIRNANGELSTKSAQSLVDSIQGVMNGDSDDTEASGQDNNDYPESLRKYPNAKADILSFIKNNIEDGHALAATIPQLQHDIYHIFGHRHGIKPEDVKNPDVATFLSKFISDAKAHVSFDDHNPDIGAGVGEVDNSDDGGHGNQNWMDSLMPARN